MYSIMDGYADDQQIYIVSHHSIHDDIGKLQHTVKVSQDWFLSHQMKLNCNKTNIIIFSNDAQRVNSPSEIELDGRSVSISDNVRDLGFLVDKSLKFDCQIQKACKNAYFHLKMISLNKHCMSKSIIEKLVLSQVLSHLNFCCPLYIGLPEYQLNKLQQVQNCAVRLIFGLSKREHISPYIKQLKWLNMRNFIKMRYAVIMYKCINCEMPQYLTGMLSFQSSTTII